jgi:hypothetical protein
MGTKPVTREEMENFAVKLTDDAPNHEAWLAIVRFEVIFREAQKQTERKKTTGRAISDEARWIFEELGLRLIVVCAGGIEGCAGGPHCTSDHK